MYFGCLGFRGELGFLNCDDVCMCVVNKHFELLEFVSESVYVDLQYDEIYLTFTAGPVCQLLFAVVMDVVPSEARSGLPSELLYADNLVLMAPTMEQLGRRVAEWISNLLDKGLKVNAAKSKVMVGSSGRKMIVNSGSGSVGKEWRQTVQCTVCIKWIHKR